MLNLVVHSVAEVILAIILTLKIMPHVGRTKKVVIKHHLEGIEYIDS
jgi:hypothetical protein